MTEDVTPRRRIPSPWHADPMPGGYVVRDANGQALAYLYSRENEDEARQAKVLTKKTWRDGSSSMLRGFRSCSARRPSNGVLSGIWDAHVII
jgi:hypothetical protein